MLWCPGWLHSLLPFQRGHFPRWIYLYVLCILQRACIQRKMLELFIWLCWKSLSSEKEAHGVCRWELKTSRPGRKPGSRSTEQVGQGWAEGPARVALPSPARREIARGRCDWSGRPQRAPVCPPGLQSPQSSSQSPPQTAGPSCEERENLSVKAEALTRLWNYIPSQAMAYFPPFIFLGTKCMCGSKKQTKSRRCRGQALATCQAPSIGLLWSFTHWTGDTRGSYHSLLQEWGVGEGRSQLSNLCPEVWPNPAELWYINGAPPHHSGGFLQFLPPPSLELQTPPLMGYEALDRWVCPLSLSISISKVGWF